MSSWYHANIFFLESTLLDSMFVLSFYIVFRAGLFSLAQVGQMAIGAYTVALLATKAGWPPILTVPTAAVIAAIGSLLFVIPVLRLRGVYLALGSIAFAGVVEVFAENLNLTGGPLGIQNVPGSIGMPEILLCLAIVLVVMEGLQRSHYAGVLRAMRVDERTAEGLGVRTGAVKVAVLLVSAAVAGLVGGLQTYTLGFVTPDRFSFSLLVLITAYAFIGGTGHWGGAFLIAIAGDALNHFLVVNSSSTQEIIFGVLLILAVTLAPNGISDPALLRAIARFVRESWARLAGERQVGPARSASPSVVGPQSQAELIERFVSMSTGEISAAQIPEADYALQVRDLHLAFTGLVALDDVSLEVRKGSVFGLIGPNGAGKTTLINVISGYLRPDAGSVLVDGREVLDLRPHALVAAGVARTYQNFQLFEGESVLDNVLMGRHRFFSPGVGAFVSARTERRKQSASAMTALDLMGLANVAKENVAGLPYGVRRRVELARALACQPSLLLLDEPAAGMGRSESDEIGGLILAIAGLGTTVVVVEHNVRLVSNICVSMAVLHFGRVLMQGPPAMVWADQAVREAYLGGTQVDAPATDNEVTR